jgi:hypothetical protein
MTHKHAEARKDAGLSLGVTSPDHKKLRDSVRSLLICVNAAGCRTTAPVWT